jgi:hypothetical protein
MNDMMMNENDMTSEVRRARSISSEPVQKDLLIRVGRNVGRDES